jgi:hypothetical protein
VERRYYREFIDTLRSSLTPNGPSRTLLFNTLLQRYAKVNDTIVLAIYLNHKEIELQSLEQLLSSLAKQLLRDDSVIPIPIQKYYEECNGLHRARAADRLSSYLADHFSSSRTRVFLVIDGWDEHPQIQSSLIKAFENISVNLYALVMSRPGHLPNPSPWVELKLQTSNEDMRLFIQKSIGSADNLAEILEDNPSLSTAVIEQIISHADGL